MGVPGPGGPCSEILYDRGPEYGPSDGRASMPEPRTATSRSGTWSSCRTSSARCGPRRTSTSSGSLPKKNIDTGMGLERVAFLLQGVENMYEIDVMFPVIERAEELTGRRYGADHEDDVRFRVVADHVRSSMMLIGDGVTPGNEGRGYVLRRLLRRAVRSMRLLGYEDRGAARADAGQPRQDGRDLRRAAPRLGADLDGRVRRGGRVPADAAGGHPDLRPGRHRGEAGRRQPTLSRRQGVRAARHLRLPDRPDPRDGRRAGPRRSTRTASAG